MNRRVGKTAVTPRYDASVAKAQRSPRKRGSTPRLSAKSNLDALYSQLGKQIMLEIQTASRKRWLIDKIDRLTLGNERIRD